MFIDTHFEQFPRIKTVLGKIGDIRQLKLVPSSIQLVVIEEYLDSLNHAEFETIHEATFDRSSHVSEVRSLTPREATIVFLNANKIN